MDHPALILMLVVATITLISIVAYVYLVKIFKMSVTSNDNLKRSNINLEKELSKTRTEMSGLRSELETLRQDKVILTTALKECIHSKEVIT